MKVDIALFRARAVAGDMRFVQPCSSATGSPVRGFPRRSSGTWRASSVRAPSIWVPCPTIAAPFWRLHLFRCRFGIGSARGDRHDVVAPRTPDAGRAGAPRSKMDPRETNAVSGCCNALAQWCKRRKGARPSDFGVSVGATCDSENGFYGMP